MTRRSLPAGFTLAEMLVALAVLGMLTAGLAQGVRTGIATWQAQGRQLGAWGDFDAADHTLRRLLARMEPGGLGGQKASLVGGPAAMTFQTRLPEAASAVPTPDADVTLAVDRAHRMVLQWGPHFPKPIGPAPAQSEIPLLTGVARLDIAYWEPNGGWRQEWAAPTLPRLIRMQVTFVQPGGRVVPPIVVRPMRDRWRQ